MYCDKNNNKKPEGLRQFTNENFSCTACGAQRKSTIFKERSPLKKQFHRLISKKRESEDYLRKNWLS